MILGLSLALSIVMLSPVFAITVGPGLHWGYGSSFSWGSKKAWSELSGTQAQKKAGACVERCTSSGWVVKETYSAYAEHRGWIYAIAEVYHDYRN